MQTIEVHPRRPDADEPVSLAHIIGIWRTYLPATLTILAAIAVAYALVAVVLYLLSPAKRVTTLPFRVVFEGADANRYPNGMNFNTTEITATPVLQKVYTANRLEKFVKFVDLKNSIFVIEYNKELERLASEFNARLSDPRLSPVDRDRIQTEYDLRRDSIRRTDFALTFVVDERTHSMPARLRTQILKSVLDVWAEQAMIEKGAGRYRIPVVSKNILAPEMSLEGRDYIVSIDILRTKVNRIITTIDQLLHVAGAEVLWTGKERITLPEVRVNLDDTRRFRLEPLLLRLASQRSGESSARDFVQSQLESARRRRDQERARVETLSRSLDLYMQRNATTTGSEGDARSAAGGAQVIPQIDKSFLDQITDLVTQKRDIDFRQRLIENINSAAISGLLPAENEVMYYETLIRNMGSGRGEVQTDAAIAAEYARAAQEIYRAVDQVSDLYATMSRNLNPGLVVYSLTEPVTESSARSFSLRRLLAFGVLLMLIAVPLVLFGTLLHNRISDEQRVERSKHRFVEAES